jgi:Prephenate dehydrogenase
MTPDHHDLVLAITSHLPHLIAYTIVGTADELGAGDVVGSDQILRRRLSRLHPHRGSDPTMWRDVFLANKEAVLEMLGTFNEDLSNSPARSAATTASAVRALHPHPRHPPRHRRDRPGFRRARLRPPARESRKEAGVSWLGIVAFLSGDIIICETQEKLVAARLLFTNAGNAPSNNLARSLRAGAEPVFIVGCNDDQFALKKSDADRNYVIPPADHPEWARCCGGS